MLSQVNQYDDAIKILEPLLTNDAQSAPAWEETARLARISGNTDLAVSTLQKASDSGILSRGLKLEEATLALLRGDVTLAASAKQEAERLPSHRPPENDPWMKELQRFDVSGFVASQEADAMVQEGRYRDAMQSFSRMTRQFPERSRPALNQALVLLSVGQVDAGIAELRKLTEVFGDDPLIHFYLARALIRKTQYAEAEKSLLEAIRLKPDFGNAFLTLGLVYEKTERLADALKCYQSATAQNPEDVAGHISLARLLLDQSRLDEAQLSLLKAEKLQPLPPEILDEVQGLRTRIQNAKAQAP